LKNLDEKIPAKWEVSTSWRHFLDLRRPESSRYRARTAPAAAPPAATVRLAEWAAKVNQSFIRLVAFAQQYDGKAIFRRPFA
jgi:hypothetical protein